MAGRRAQPIEKRVGKGNPTRRPIPKDVPARVSGEPKPPKGLAGHALECWKEYAGILKARGQWSRDSRLSFTALCEVYAEWRELADDLKKNGRFQTCGTKAGGTMERARPALSAFQDADRRLRAWLIEFGLTDASRAKVSGTPEEETDEENPLKEFGLH